MIRTERFNLMLSPEELEHLRRKAMFRDVSMADVVRMGIQCVPDFESYAEATAKDHAEYNYLVERRNDLIEEIRLVSESFISANHDPFTPFEVDLSQEPFESLTAEQLAEIARVRATGKEQPEVTALRKKLRGEPLTDAERAMLKTREDAARAAGKFDGPRTPHEDVMRHIHLKKLSSELLRVNELIGKINQRFNSRR